MHKKIWIINIKVSRIKTMLIILAIIFIGYLFVFKDNSLNVFNNTSNEYIVIDPGHGGIDVGTSKNGILEKDINLDVGLKLQKYLKKKGFKSIITRDKDIAMDHLSKVNESRQRKDLNARTNIINNNGNMFVSLHVNYSPAGEKVRGVEIFYYPTSLESKKLAESIKESIDEKVYKDFLKIDWLKTKVLSQDFYILRETDVTGVLVEIGYITNSNDRALIQDEAYKQKMVEAITEGIKKYKDSIK
ncbi:N-acetylmuramoyl-L-alanine amidase [Gottschalkia purinilytica]|uniref:N-acetylmuramoyl-L-alanine amidase n=1 Tax=Gottschalkia purinilytica TaxID=1503 RepID=A0A0L0WEH0_GOTPU|nr:N-acetylmuramoyl-L-alanine amidase [Gottschalkia purinilytica]KNF09864.1 N-acetylmuramoyl-L-alanine amidase [Gottschalkia purinilytica]